MYKVKAKAYNSELDEDIHVIKAQAAVHQPIGMQISAKYPVCHWPGSLLVHPFLFTVTGVCRSCMDICHQGEWTKVVGSFGRCLVSFHWNVVSGRWQRG